MTIEYRESEYDDFDIEAVVNIARAIRPDDLDSVTEYADRIAADHKAGRVCVRWLASIDGCVIGSAHVGQSSSFPPEFIAVYVAVHPDHQHRGFGRELLARAEATAALRGGATAYSWSDDTQPRSWNVLERAGYRQVERGWASVLDLASADAERLENEIARTTAAGIRIASVATISQEHDDWSQRLYQLFVTLERDVPSAFPIQRMSFSDFETQSLGSRFIGDGFFVALDGDQLVGLTEPHRVDGAPDVIAQWLTGVLRDYRGRGIASALKARGILWAIDSGYSTIRTHNSQSNEPMLAVNDRLGFVRGRSTVTYFKDL